MNEREKNFFDMMCGLGKAIMEEAKKTSIRQDACHMIVFSPESGYVKAQMFNDGKIYESTRFDQFPNIDVKVREDKFKHLGDFGGKHEENETAE